MRNAKSTSLAVLALVLGARAQEAGPAGAYNSKLLALQAGGDARVSSVEVLGDRPLSFTTLRLSGPPRVVVDFADTEVTASERELTIDDGTVKRVAAAPAGSRTARLVIELVQESEFEVRAVGNRVEVRVPRLQPLMANAPAPKPAAPAAAEPVAAPETAPERVAAAEPQAEPAPSPETPARNEPSAEDQKVASLPKVALVGSRPAAPQPVEKRAPAETPAIRKRRIREERIAAYAQAQLDAAASVAAAREAARAAKIAADRRAAEERRLAAAEKDARAAEWARVAAAEKAQAAEKARAAAAQERAKAAQAAAEKRARQAEQARVAAAENKARAARQAAEKKARAEQAAAEKRARAERAAAEEKSRADAAVQARAEKKARAEQAAAEEKARAEAAAQARAEKKARAEQAAAEDKARAQARAEKKARAAAEEKARAEQAAAEKRAAAARAAKAEASAKPSRSGRKLALAAPAPLRNSITGIGFRPIRGGEVIVRSDHPLEYGVSGEENAVLLHLPSAGIPLPNNRRPLDTRFFEGPVQRVVPVAVAGGTDVRIELKGHAEYQLEQVGSVLTVTFSNAAP